MDITVDLIKGLSFGLEFVEADEDDGFDQHAIVLDFAFIRVIFFWIDQSE